MIGLDLKTSFIVDTRKVLAAMDKAKRRSLARGGALVRTIARRSIRKRRGISEPGRPPSSHSGELRLIFFGYDEAADAVVVGPIRFRSAASAADRVPTLLEQGGVVVREGEPVEYDERPFMGPAVETAAPRLAEMFRDTLRT
ncbi:MAG: hypothetical protein AAF078_01905 [Planctomycetota bacterium]